MAIYRAVTDTTSTPDTPRPRPGSRRRGWNSQAVNSGWLSYLNSALVWGILGALIAIGTAVAVEALRRPKLELRIPRGEGLPVWKWNRDKAGRSPAEVPFAEAYFAYLEVHHRELPAWVKWLLREPAIGCYGEISVHRYDTFAPIWDSVQGPMLVRWFRSPDPRKSASQETSIFDLSEFAPRPRMDIIPGDSELIDVIAYMPGDEYIHFWNNESYTYPGWRNIKRRVRPGRYYVAATVICSGASWRGVFELDLDNPENIVWHSVRKSAAQQVWAQYKILAQSRRPGFT
jgi:hypothetical protein